MHFRPSMVHLINRISILHEVFDLVLSVAPVVCHASVEPNLVAMSRMQVCFDALEVRAWILSVAPCRLVVLNHKAQIDQRPQLQLASIHPEVLLGSIVFPTVRRLEHPEELVEAFASLGNVCFNALDALYGKRQ